MTPPDTHLEHLLPTPDDEAARLSRRRFLGGVGAVAGVSAVGGAAIGALALPGAAHAAPPAGASNFHILAKAYRAADTRPGEPAKSFTWVNDRQIRIKIAGTPHPDPTVDGVPADATAVVLTVTGIKRGTKNNIRAFPTGPDLPLVSNLNLDPNGNSANMVTVKLGDGSVDVAARLPCHMVVDVLGYYRTVDPTVDGGKVRGGRYVTLPTPWRAYDSQSKVPAERYTIVDVHDQLPSHAGSVVINLTAANASSNGFFSALPNSASGEPTTSNLNVSFAGETRAGAAVVPLEKVGGRFKIKVYAKTSARIVVDVFGYYTSSDSPSSIDGLFVPMNPVRIRDTRDDVLRPRTAADNFGPPRPDEPIGRLWPGQMVETLLPESIRNLAAAVVVNVTAVQPRAPRGHIRVSGAKSRLPETSSLNWSVDGATIPNHVISTVTPYGIQAYTNRGCHVIFDLAGYFTGGPLLWELSSYGNPAPPVAPPEWTLTVPRLGLVSRVLSGINADPIVNAGHSWHWSGTGLMGQDGAHVSVFGHRTEYGGPYRYVHTLQAGDLAVVRTQDGREFTYRYVRRDIVLGAEGSRDPGTLRILAATKYHPGRTLSMISCTEPNGLPTDVDHRRIDTFALISWRQL